ncbi:UNVERIFIED_CONTAM: hypothetical protein ITH36_25290, partial [Salmonella enterica subsp. enterica serovar Weltevreden]
RGSDGLMRTCVFCEEAQGVLSKCHGEKVGGHYGASKMAAKILASGFYWPTLFKDAHAFVKAFDACQRSGNISKRHEMPLRPILECEIFDV